MRFVVDAGRRRLDPRFDDYVERDLASIQEVSPLDLRFLNDFLLPERGVFLGLCLLALLALTLWGSRIASRLCKIEARPPTSAVSR